MPAGLARGAGGRELAEGLLVDLDQVGLLAAQLHEETTARRREGDERREAAGQQHHAKTQIAQRKVYEGAPTTASATSTVEDWPRWRGPRGDQIYFIGATNVPLDSLAVAGFFDRQFDKQAWPAIREKLAQVLATRTRDEWCALLEGTDACVAPILTMAEAPAHPHLAARETFVTHEGIVQPAPAPRFSRTPSAIQSPASVPASPTSAVLARWTRTSPF